MLQLRIHAVRERDPNIYAEVIVNVAVNRNPNRPTFLHGDKVFNISETYTPGVIFANINATDEDAVSLTFLLTEILFKGP